MRPGNAGANTAADHITVLDQALAQIPDAHRHGNPMLVRTDGAGCSTAFLAHVRGLHEHGVLTEFTVGWAVGDRERAAISTLPARAWTAAVDATGRHRDGAAIAELSGLLPAGTFAGYPTGMRVLVRRERPHPGAQLDAFEDRDGWRYQCLATDTGVGQLSFLGARHRAHARVEDRIRCGKDTGPGRFPPAPFAVNEARLTAVMLAVDLITWAQTLAPARPAGPGSSRTEDAALPATARRRPPRPRRTPTPTPPRPALALGEAARRRLHPLPRATPTRPLNPGIRPDHRSRRTRHPQAGRPTTTPPHHHPKQDPQPTTQLLVNDRG